MAQHRRDPAANDKTIANRLAHRGVERRRTEVQRDRLGHLAAQFALAFDIRLVDRTFIDGDAFVLIESLHHRHRRTHIHQHAVPIHVEPIMRRRDRANRLHLLVDVKPGAGLEFVEDIPVPDCVLRFSSQVLRAHLRVPPSDRAPVAHLTQIKQAMHRHFQRLANHVVDRHLQTGAEAVVA